MPNPLRLLSPTTGVTPENKIRIKGRKMLRQGFEDQKAFGFSLQKKFSNLSNEGILTTALPLTKDLPQKYRERIQKFRASIKEIIVGIATEIQDQKFETSNRDLTRQGLSPFQQSRCLEITKGQKELYVSYDTVKESLNCLKDFNNSIREEIAKVAGPKKIDLLLLNGLIVYELNDAVIELLEDFQARGKETLRAVNDEMSKDMIGHAAADDTLWEDALALGQNGDSIRKDIEKRRKIRYLVSKKWDAIWRQCDRLEGNISAAQGCLPLLRLNRTNARQQINTLEEVGIVQILDSNLKSFEEICAITDFELAPLSAEDVCELIGLPEHVSDSLQKRLGVPVSTLVSIISKSSNKCLDAPLASAANAGIQQWDSHGGSNQRWTLQKAGDYFVIISEATGKCLEVEASSITDGASIVQGIFGGENHQLWILTPDDQGFHTITSKSSSQALDIPDQRGDNGALIQQWPTHGGDNQKWRIEEMPA